MWSPGRVGWAWVAAVVLSMVSGAAGFWIGGGLGAGIGVAAGGLVPLLIERAARRQETVVSARRAEGPRRRYGPAHVLDPGLGVVPFTGRSAELGDLEQWCGSPGSALVRLVTGDGGAGKTRLALELAGRMAGQGWRCASSMRGPRLMQWNGSARLHRGRVATDRGLRRGSCGACGAAEGDCAGCGAGAGAAAGPACR
jgi:hypothetical protein